MYYLEIHRKCNHNQKQAKQNITVRLKELKKCLSIHFYIASLNPPVMAEFVRI